MRSSSNNVVNINTHPRYKLHSVPVKDIITENIDFNMNISNDSEIHDLLEKLIPEILDLFEKEGFEIATDKDIKDGAFLFESFRSILYRHKDIDHPFQKLADKLFNLASDGNISASDGIHLDLNINRS